MADIVGIDGLFRRLTELATDIRQVQRPLEAAGAVMLGSIEENFQQQGRPQKWTPLSARTLAGRRQGRNKKRSPQILIDRARLKNSMAMKVNVGSDSYVEVGTNVVYAARHHFGYAGGTGRGRSKTPARPFLMIQDEDYDQIGAIFNRHISRL